MARFDLRAGVLMAVVLTGVVALAAIDPIPQDVRYHEFADTRTRYGIRNFWNVVSNLPFLLVGMVGMLRLPQLARPATRLGYGVICASIVLVGLGSATYHAAPSNGSLFWDRLPMTVVFMALLSLVLDERVFGRERPGVLGVLGVVGVASALYWVWSETQSQGDLRPYALVQFLPAALVPLILFMYPRRYLNTGWWLGALVCYGAAKAFEHFDGAIWDATGTVGGHALKHVAAAVAVLCIVLAVPARRRCDTGTRDATG